MATKKFLIIGGDAAGMSAAARARRRDPELEIEALERGGFVSYAACGIPYFISGEVKALHDLVVVTPDEFEKKRGIRVRLHHRVEKIDPEKKLVIARNLETDRLLEFPYDDLLIATGAAPIVPAGLSLSLPGVFTVRGLAKTRELKEFIAANSPREALIVGGGYIGLEMAEALAGLGLKVQMTKLTPREMLALEEEVSEEIIRELADNGVELTIGAGAEKLEPDPAGRLKIALSNGEERIADLVIVAAGVRPESELARQAGLELGEKGAIKVDRRQRTSADHVYAAGDCAEAYHRLLKRNAYIPLALTANRQGRVAGTNVTGGQEEFAGMQGSAVTRVFELTAARTGLGRKEAADAGFDAEKVYVKSNSRAHYFPGSRTIHTVLIVEKNTGRLLGAQMAGRDGVAHRINLFALAAAQGISVSELKDADLAYAPPFSPVFDPVLQAAEVAAKKIG